MLTPDQLTAIDRHLRKENWLLNEELIRELTDHYVAGTEERMQRGIPFEAAIRDIHTGFGERKGLLELEESAQLEQSAKYARLEWQFVRSFTQGPQWYVGAGLLVLTFLLNTSLGKYDTFKAANMVGFGIVASAVAGHLISRLVLAIRHWHEVSPVSLKNGSPVFVALYSLIATSLLVNKYILHRFTVPLPTNAVLLLTTLLETLCLIYGVSVVKILWQVLHDDRKRRALKIH